MQMKSTCSLRHILTILSRPPKIYIVYIIDDVNAMQIITFLPLRKQQQKGLYMFSTHITHMCVYMPMCRYSWWEWRPEITIRCFPQSFHLLVWGRISCYTGAHPLDKTSWPTSPGSSCLHPTPHPSTGMCVLPHSALNMDGGGSELRPQACVSSTLPIEPPPQVLYEKHLKKQNTFSEAGDVALSAVLARHAYKEHAFPIWKTVNNWLVVPGSVPQKHINRAWWSCLQSQYLGSGGRRIRHYRLARYMLQSQNYFWSWVGWFYIYWDKRNHSKSPGES